MTGRCRAGSLRRPELAQAVEDAARWTEARRNELLAAGEGIAFETVFSSPGKVDFVARANARSRLMDRDDGTTGQVASLSQRLLARLLRPRDAFSASSRPSRLPAL